MPKTIELDRGSLPSLLRGPEGRTLFILAAEWHGIENVDALADRTGQVLVAHVHAPRAGWPQESKGVGPQPRKRPRRKWRSPKTGRGT